jgi:hypothetical protein
VGLRWRGGLEGFNQGMAGALSRCGGRCLAGVHGESGQKEGDKKSLRVYSKESKRVCCGLWRKHGSGGGRLAWRKGAHSLPAICSMKRRTKSGVQHGVHREKCG